MKGHAGAAISTSSLRAGVHAAEAVCNLPAVPTLDWCDRAARALLPLRQPSLVLVMFAKLGPGGMLARLECAGVAGCSVAEVSTRLGRPQTLNSVIALNATHPAIGRIRSGAQSSTELGWQPAPPEDHAAARVHIMPIELTTLPEGSALRARWDGAGAHTVAAGATPLPAGEPGRMLIVELGLLEPPAPALSTPAAAGAMDDVELLAAVLPALARRATIAFGSSCFSESTCLTHREEFVLQHLLYGKSVRQIAEEIERSPHTVHDHVKSLHRKLNSTTRGALVARALGHVRPPMVPAFSEENGEPAGKA